MLTYQDFERAEAQGQTRAFMLALIREHCGSEAYRTAVDADLYDKQRNVTINNYTRLIQARTKNPIVDVTAANNRIASNFFHRLNIQRCTYSLGNGVSFTQKERRIGEDGAPKTVDVIKERLGTRFDADLYGWGYNALIHGVAYGMWNRDRLYVFPITEFAPMWDENDGSLRAGVRFWRVDASKPMTATLYTEQGYAVYKTGGEAGASAELVEVEPMRPYKFNTVTTRADGTQIVSAENYGGRLPIVPMWGSRRKQSTLVGLRQNIDAYDLIQSGFANDLSDCAKIYWIIQNCGGMSEKDLDDFLERLRFKHIAQADTQSFNGDARQNLTPYTQDVPYNATDVFLRSARAAMYEAFGALDVHTIAASATNDHIDAAYQPMDEEADDFEYQVIQAVQDLLALMGVNDTPQFKRNRISNAKETTEMVLEAANLIGRRKALEKLPWITVDEVDEIELNEDTAARERLMSGAN